MRIHTRIRILASFAVGVVLLTASASGIADEVIRSPDGSKRIYLRERGEGRDALVDDTGRLIGYRVETDSGWKYTAPDGSRLGSVTDEDSGSDD